MTILPPPIYLHTPTIPVIEHVLSFAELQNICVIKQGKAPLPPGQVAYGCAQVQPGKRCDLYIMAPSAYKEGQRQYDETHRHEIAHCNGWPADHSLAPTEARPVKTVPIFQPKQPAAPVSLAPPLALKPWPIKEKEPPSTFDPLGDALIKKGLAK